jgi:transglutaminase-like putative cysteine protease
VRNLALIAAVLAAYLLLRGHPERIPELPRTCLAVLALVAGLGCWGRRPRPRDGTALSRRPPGWLDHAAIGAAVLALECVFVLFLAATPPPLETAAAKLESWWRPVAAAERATSAAAPAGNWLWDDHRQRPLPRRTNLKPGNRPEVFLRPADAATAAMLLQRRIYVSAFAFGRYRDAAWSTRDTAPLSLRAAPDGWLRLDGGRGGESIDCEVFHAADHPAGNPLTGLQGLIAAELPELSGIDEGLRILPPPGASGYQYRTVSKPLSLDDLPPGSPAHPATGVPPEWLALPSGAAGDKLAALARAAAGDGTPLDRLRRLRGHLRTTLAYSLRTDNPRDLDPLENFLFHEQRGHCEYFASAGALLARALGVPSRVAYGWAGGTYYEGSNLFVFRAREAHAWTEVLLEDHGWTVLDATPPGALDRELARTAPPEENPPAAADLTTAEAVLAAPDGGGLQGPLLLAAGFISGALALALLRARRHGAPAGGTGHRDPAADGYLAAFRHASQRHGRPLAGSQPLRRHLAALPDAPPFVRELQAYHYAIRYEGRAPDRRTEQRLRKAAEDWK